MWTKLLCHIDIKEGLKPRIINGKWRKPLICGRKKAELKKYFEMAGVPWIYSATNTTFNLNSPYNKIPRVRKSVMKKEIRDSEIAKNIIQANEKDLKSRMERLDKKPLKGKDKFLQFALPVMLEQAQRNIHTLKTHQELESSKKEEENPLDSKKKGGLKNNERDKITKDTNIKSDSKEMNSNPNLEEKQISQKKLKKVKTNSQRKSMEDEEKEKGKKREEAKGKEEEKSEQSENIEANFNLKSNENETKSFGLKTDMGNNLNNLGTNKNRQNFSNEKEHSKNSNSKTKLEKQDAIKMSTPNKNRGQQIENDNKQIYNSKLNITEEEKTSQRRQESKGRKINVSSFIKKK